MKRMLAMLLCALLALALLPAVPAAAADVPAWLEGLPDGAQSLCEELYQDYGCVLHAGGNVRASELESGGAYTFADDTLLILDADLRVKALCAVGGLTIRGDACLTAEILYACWDAPICVESGTIVCPVMDDPPQPGKIVQNGLCGLGGVVIEGGSVRCPVISGCGELVAVTGGTVRTDDIHAILGYYQRGGEVEAGSVWGREGVSVSGGTLTAGRICGMNASFTGGVITADAVETEWGEVLIRFPMAITEPENGQYLGGAFVDADGNPVSRVRIERLEIPVPFTDVSAQGYYYDPMLWAIFTGVTNGVSETRFAPERECTRAEAVTFLWRAFGCPEPEITALPFRDVAPGAWYADAVRWAVESGVTLGTSEAAFSPNKCCTRAEIVTLLWRSAGSPDGGAHFDGFADVPAGAWFAGAVDWAAGYGVTNGTSDTAFSPDLPCTRAQIVTFLYRLFN